MKRPGRQFNPGPGDSFPPGPAVRSCGAGSGRNGCTAGRICQARQPRSSEATAGPQWVRHRACHPEHPKLGEVRPSQVIFTYGVGALIDLPHLSALVMGLDDWTVDGGVARTIDEERLLRTVRAQLGSQVQRLLAPPAVPPTMGHADPFSELARIGVPVALFPRWLFCPRCQRLAPLSNGLFERRDDPFHPERTRYLHGNCEKDKQPVAVPARFLVACENGHLDDFPWIEFVHRGPTTCSALLRLIEYGPSGEARDLEVRCDACDTPPRRLAEAFGEEGRARMPQCRGRRPHLRDFAEQAVQSSRPRPSCWARRTSGSPTRVTALAIPTESAKLAQLVEEKWATLQQVPNEQFITLMRQMTPNPFGDFIGYSDAEIWQAIEKQRAQEPGWRHGRPERPEAAGVGEALAPGEPHAGEGLPPARGCRAERL